MKFLKYLVNYLFYPFSFLFPRNKRRWTFGSYRGAFNDNSKYLFIHTCKNHKDIDAAWVSSNMDTVRLIRSYNLKAYSVFSPRGAWHALTSKYWFFNSYTSDIMFCMSGGAVCVNLWHGIGLKRAEFNIRTGVLADRFYRRTLKERYYHPEAFRRPDWLLSSSDMQSAMFATAFRIDGSRCLNLGYPRNRILTATEEERYAFVGEYEPPQTKALVDSLKGKYAKVFVYMPTWRDSQRHIFAQSIDLPQLDRLLKKKNYFLMLKPHANTVVDMAQTGNLSNIALLDATIDIYSVLPYTDVLITDYSSVLYDYILMDKKDIVLYIYDYDQYVSDRDFFFPYDENVTGYRAYDFAQLLHAIETDNYGNDPRKIADLRQRFWGVSAAIDSNEAIVEHIKRLDCRGKIAVVR